jgi:mRNA-degrading endonuclease RelE of RelBE toxin-antitoxin system
LEALPAQSQAAINQALSILTITGQGDVKPLKGRAGYRLRVGEHRVIFSDDQVTILAIQIGRRTTTTS